MTGCAPAEPAAGRSAESARAAGRRHAQVVWKLILCVLFAGPLVAGGESFAQSSDGPGYLVAADRRMVLRLKRVEELLAEGKYDEAARFAQLILDAAEDGFFHPDPDQPETYRSLKSAAIELIGRIPPTSSGPATKRLTASKPGGSSTRR